MINIQDVRPVYLFYGSERFLLQAALQELIAAVAPGDNPFNLTRLNGESASMAEILTHANTLPFFTERKLVIVDNCPQGWFANRKRRGVGGNSGRTGFGFFVGLFAKPGRKHSVGFFGWREH